MGKYLRKVQEVEAERVIGAGLIETSQGWSAAMFGDWIVRANDKVWIVEGDVFDDLYEPVDLIVEVANDK